MKTLLILLTAVFTGTISYGQTVTFQKVYGNLNEEGRCMQKTTDGGFIIAGETFSLGAGPCDIYLVKTDSNGVLQWTKTLGDTLYEQANSIQQTTDGGFIIAGWTYRTNNYDIYLVKTDSSGNLQWAQSFGGANDEYGVSVQQTADSGYIVAGNTASFGAGNDDVYVIKTSSSGMLQWTKTFGGSQSDVCSSVELTTDGGFIFAGGTMSFGAGGQDVYLIKTDSAGNLQWGNTFGGPLNDGAISARQTRDGGYAIIGGANSFGGGDIYLVKTDSSGNLQWTKTFGQTGYEVGYSVKQTKDQGYIISGNTRSFNNTFNWDIYLLKTDSIGGLQWSRVLGGAYDENAYSVLQTNDDGYILAGGTGSFFGSGLVYLIKTDSSGNSGCNDSIPATLVGTGGTQGSGGTQGTGGTANSASTLAGSGGTETILCTTVGVNERISGSGISIYPNPFSFQAVLKTDKIFYNVKLILTDRFGQQLKQVKNISGQTFVLSREGLANGLYFVQLMEENRIIAIEKLVIAD